VVSDVWSAASTQPEARSQRQLAHSGSQRTQRLARVGASVQVYSKAKNVWCDGRIVKLVKGEAAEVSYRAPGAEGGGKERVKKLRLDSENLRLGAP
jgi:hypothetical protein